MGYPSFSAGDVLAASDMNAVGLWKNTSATVTSVGGTSATASNGTITIGSGNTSVTVSSAFSSDYTNYRIIFDGGTGSGTNNLSFQLSGITGSVYRQLGFYQAWGTAAPTDYADGAGATSWLVAQVTTSGYSWIMDITGPQAARIKFATISGLGSVSQYTFPSFCNSTTSATGFVLTPGAGTITGGTIRIYGYRN